MSSFTFISVSFLTKSPVLKCFFLRIGKENKFCTIQHSRPTNRKTNKTVHLCSIFKVFEYLFLLSPLSPWLYSVCCSLLFCFCHLKQYIYIFFFIYIYTQEAICPVGLETDLQAPFFSPTLFHLEQLLYFV